jgi:DNA transformation protein and related proteins
VTVDGPAIRDLFASLGPVRTRTMFGGQGIYCGERMFALEAAGEIFLKADAETIPAFRAAGSRPFTYRKNGAATTMSYWLLPETALDDPDEAGRWGRLALEAAGRSKLPRRRSRARNQTSASRGRA